MKPVAAALAQRPDSPKLSTAAVYDPYFPSRSVPTGAGAAPAATVFNRSNSPAFPKAPPAPRG